MNYDKAAGLALANMWVGFIAFLAAAFMGLYQVAERSGLLPAIESPKLYFASVSTHGVHVPNTNMATMVVPGYIAEVTTRFPRTGEYSLLCNEYCGLGHDSMWSRLVVVPKSVGGESS